jgi:hypothetical protein
MAVSFRLVRWDQERLLAKAPRILDEFGAQVAFQAEQEIAKRQWEWPVPTLRKSGELVPKGKRDIYDTGALMESATDPQVAVTEDGAALSIRWMAPYSKAVQEGGYLVGTVRNSYVAPPRDWVASTYQQLKPGGERPLLPFFIRRWRQTEGAR